MTLGKHATSSNLEFPSEFRCYHRAPRIHCQSLPEMPPDLAVALDKWSGADVLVFRSLCGHRPLQGTLVARSVHLDSSPSNTQHCDVHSL